MTVKLVCPICGKEFECTEPHEPHRDVLSGEVKCPLNKGAIHVFVKDDRNEGVSGVQVYSAGTAKTDLGFALFDKLDAGSSYQTGIKLDESDQKVKSNHYPGSRTEVTAKVTAGKITVIEFLLIGYGTILAILEGTEDEQVLSRVRFTVNGAPGRTKEGKAEFEKLEPTEDHKVCCELHEDDRKSFKLEEAEQPNRKVSSGRTTEVPFRVTRRYWVDLVLVDPKSGELTGAFSLQQDDVLPSVDGVGRDVKHVPDLKPGTVDVEGVTLPESREFARLT